MKRGDKVKIVKGLFAGEEGIIEDISRDNKSMKLEGRSWYPKRILKIKRTRKYHGN